MRVRACLFSASSRLKENKAQSALSCHPSRFPSLLFCSPVRRTSTSSLHDLCPEFLCSQQRLLPAIGWKRRVSNVGFSLWRTRASKSGVSWQTGTRKSRPSWSLRIPRSNTSMTFGMLQKVSALLPVLCYTIKYPEMLYITGVISFMLQKLTSWLLLFSNPRFF